jgi:hypothetical protein
LILDIFEILAYMLLTHFGSILVALTIIICTIHLSKRMTRLENIPSHTPTHAQMDTPIDSSTQVKPLNETQQAKPKRTIKKKESEPQTTSKEPSAQKETIEKKILELAKGEQNQ